MSVSFRQRFAAVMSCAFALGCQILTVPALPDDAARFVPPPAYAQWWAITESCSGVTRPLEAVQFYRVPHATVSTQNHGDVAGYWSLASNRIVLADRYLGDGQVVRHEMLHALVQGDGHPPVYFQGRCAGVVDCAQVGCRDEGPEPVRAPAGAPALSVADVDLRVELQPNPAARSGADTVLSIVVRATNPTSTPVRVTLDATPSTPGSPAYTAFFGARASLGGAGTLATVQQTITAVPLPFAAGESRLAVFDLNLARYPSGDYTIVGLFNSRQVLARVRVMP